MLMSKPAVPMFDNFIGGRSAPSASGSTFENRNPANSEDLIGVFPESSTADGLAAIAAAKEPCGAQVQEVSEMTYFLASVGGRR